MSERDRAAIDVRFIALKAENLFHSEILRSEGLVNFDQIHLVELKPREGESFLNGRNGADTHNLRRNSRSCPADNAAEWFPSALLRNFGVRDDNGRSAVDNPTGVSRSHDAFLAKGGRQRLQDFHGGFGATVVIFRDNDSFLA